MLCYIPPYFVPGVAQLFSVLQPYTFRLALSLMIISSDRSYIDVGIIGFI